MTRRSTRELAEFVEPPNHAALLSLAAETPPITAGFEALKNAWEGDGKNPGATQIWIFPGEDGELCILDNGCGIAADRIKFLIGGLAASTKKVEADGNFGHGITLLGAAHNPDGTDVISWTKGELKAAWVIFGTSESNGGLKVSLFKVDGRSSLARVDKPYPQLQSGTLIKFSQIPFDADAVAMQVQDHFDRFQDFRHPDRPEAEILVCRTDPFAKSSKPIRLQSLYARAALHADNTLGHTPAFTWSGEYLHATLHLLERPTPSLAAIYETYRGEVVARLEQGEESTATRATAYGLWAGVHRMVLIVQRRNPPSLGVKGKIKTDLLRQGARDWKRPSAYAESKKLVPPLVAKWMQQFEDNNFDPPDDEAEATNNLRRWRLEDELIPSFEGTGKAEEGKDAEQPATGGGSRAGGGSRNGPSGNGRKAPVKRARSPRSGGGSEEPAGEVPMGEPSARFQGGEMLGASLGYYVPPTRHVIVINRDAGATGILLAQADREKWTQKEKRQLRGLLKACAISGVTRLVAVTGKLPGESPDDQSMTAILANPTAALEFAAAMRTKYAKKASK